MKGTIRKLVADRGYGFIRTDKKENLFFHRNDVVGVAYESLTEGQQVEFGITRTAKQGVSGSQCRPRVAMLEDGSEILFSCLMKVHRTELNDRSQE